MQNTPLPRRLAIVGRGRLGTALAEGLRRAGRDVVGPLGRDYAPAEVADAGLVLLCVPDTQVAHAAAVLGERRSSRDLLVGHCSGAIGLAELGGFESLSLHPLMTVTAATPPPPWPGVAGAVAGSSPRATRAAVALARDLGLRAVEISESDRAAYHAAASIASNFLVTLEEAAARLAESAGAQRDLLVPLVRQTVENWAAAGPAALTGPIARGDEDTVARQREAIGERAPELLELFDALAAATRDLVHEAVRR